MKVEIVQKNENPLLKRTELKFNVTHESSPTPKRVEVKAGIASELNVPEELVVIEKISSLHGKNESSGIARVYATKESLESMEPQYLIKRGAPKEEKAEKPAEKKPEEAEKPAEKAPEKPKEG